MAEQTVRIEGVVQDKSSNQNQKSSSDKAQSKAAYRLENAANKLEKAKILEQAAKQQLRAAKTLEQAARLHKNASQSYYRASSIGSGLSNRAHISDGRNTRTAIEKLHFGGAESVSVIKGISGVMSGNMRQMMMFAGQMGKYSAAIASVIIATNTLMKAFRHVADEMERFRATTGDIINQEKDEQMEELTSAPKTEENKKKVKSFVEQETAENEYRKEQRNKLNKQYKNLRQDTSTFGLAKEAAKSLLPESLRTALGIQTHAEKREEIDAKIKELNKDIAYSKTRIKQGQEYLKPEKRQWGVETQHESILDNMSKMGFYMTKSFGQGEGDVQYQQLQKSNSLLERIEKNTRESSSATYAGE